MQSYGMIGVFSTRKKKTVSDDQFYFITETKIAKQIIAWLLTFVCHSLYIMFVITVNSKSAVPLNVIIPAGLTLSNCMLL